MYGGIFTITHDGQTSHYYKRKSDVYEVPSLIFKANRIALDYDTDIHEAYEHMNHEGRYIDKDFCAPDQRMFETISGSIVDVMLDGFGKSNQ